MEKNYRIYNIKWDTDGENANLPTELNARVNLPLENAEEYLSDYLSDKFGYCHKGFEFEEADGMYIVVCSGGNTEAPLYNGACIVAVCNTLEKAKEELKAYAAEWGREYDLGEDWKPGYQSDEESVKWSDHYFDEDCMTAWVNGTEENWTRVEIFTADANGRWHSVFS